VCRLRCVSTIKRNDLKAVTVTVLRVEDGSRFHRAETVVEMSSCRSLKEHTVDAGVEQCLNAATMSATVCKHG